MSDQASDRANAPEARSRRSSYRRVAHSALLTLTVLWGCAGTAMTSRASAQPSVRTDRSEYVWQVDPDRLRLEIPWTFTNPLPDTLFWNNCFGDPGPRLEKLVRGEWRLAARGRQRSSLDCAIMAKLPPAATHVDTTLFYGPLRGGDSIVGIHERYHIDGVRISITWDTINVTRPVFPFDDFDGTYRLNWSNDASRPRSVPDGPTRERPPRISDRPLPPDVPFVSAPFRLIDPREGR